MIDLKTIGKEVCFLKADDDRPRMGEGAFLRLKDGTIMFAYSEFCGGSVRDHGLARIAAIYSKDEGETWGDHRVLMEIVPDDDHLNIMSVSLLRVSEDKILLFHGKKIRKGEHVYTRPQINISTDEGKTWSQDHNCIEQYHYYVHNNDRALQLRDGRLIISVAKYESLEEVYTQEKRFIQFFISDDHGLSWRKSESEFQMPFENKFGFEEPGLYEHEDGTLWCYIRTDIGCQFESVSHDRGETWSVPKANTFFSSARSPMLVRKVCEKYTVAVFNPIMKYTGRPDSEVWGRTPYLIAVSENDGITHDGKSFDRLFYLEDDRKNAYCYPAIFDGGSYFLVAYYHSDGCSQPLRSQRIKKVLAEELR